MGRASRARQQAKNAIDRRIVPGRLAGGLPGPGGVVLRLARSGESGAVAALAESAGGPVEEEMLAAIEDGTYATALVAGLRTGQEALRLPIAHLLATGDPKPMMAGLSLALVAEQDGKVVGALYAMPPGQFMAQVLSQGVDPTHSAIVAVGAAKIKAVAVDPDVRGQGIASALLTVCTRLYDQLGYHLIYGSFAVGSGLESFYDARGFEVLGVGEGIPMWVILGTNATLGPGPGERLFARWRN